MGRWCSVFQLQSQTANYWIAIVLPELRRGNGGHAMSFIRILFIIIGAAAVLFVLLGVLACAVISGEESRKEEEHDENGQMPRNERSQ